jgi:hypothetical protein
MRQINLVGLNRHPGSMECRYRGLIGIFPPEAEIIAEIFASGIANNCSNVKIYLNDQTVSAILACCNDR